MKGNRLRFIENNWVTGIFTPVEHRCYAQFNYEFFVLAIRLPVKIGACSKKCVAVKKKFTTVKQRWLLILLLL
jgi:hypothetical protein